MKYVNILKCSSRMCELKISFIGGLTEEIDYYCYYTLLTSSIGIVLQLLSGSLYFKGP